MLSIKTSRPEGIVYVRFGSKADICVAIGHVRFTPNSDRESEIPQRPCLLYPQKRTCAVQLSSIVVSGRHLQSVALGLVVIDPELRVLFCQQFRDALHRR